MSEEKSEAERVYPIRIVGPAADDVTQAADYLSGIAGEPYAAEWETGFYDCVRNLSSMPRKHLIVRILHVRHASRRPMTRKEADALRLSLDAE